MGQNIDDASLYTKSGRIDAANCRAASSALVAGVEPRTSLEIDD
jgi:hypothetical protein